MSSIGVCKLCFKKAKLLSKSHVIPNFMYKIMKDGLNRMQLVDFKFPLKPNYKQTGFYEKNILCSECDNNRLSSLERYADLLLFGGQGKALPRFQNAIGPDGVKSIILENVDFRKLKLFLLSILWRSHISKQRFFNDININDNEERLRLLLLEKLELTDSEFKVSMIAVKSERGTVKLVSMPKTIFVDTGNVAVFFMNGIFYFIDLIPNSSFELFTNNYLKDNGKYEIMLLEGSMAASFMQKFGIPDYVTKYYFL